MGSLYYGYQRVQIDFEDRVLAHLQLVIGAKLRRDEGFFFTFREPDNGHSSIWMSTHIPIEFDFRHAERPRINRRWITALMATANSGRGLVLVDEPSRDDDGAYPEL